MPGAIATLPRLKFTDLSGGPLASGTLTTYLSGSTTKTPTWQDQALTILNTNPVVLDANGSCIVWLDNTKAYKIVLADKNGVVQWTQSNVVGGGVDTSVVLNAALIQSAVDQAAASAAAALATKTAIDHKYRGALSVDPATRTDGSANVVGDEYFSTAANLLKRWNGAAWQASDISTANLAAAGGAGLVGANAYQTQDDVNKKVISLARFGAVGNGIVDDTVAIQAAIDHAKTNGFGKVEGASNKNYLITAPIYIQGDFGYKGIEFCGNTSTITATHNGPALIIDAGTANPAPEFKIRALVHGFYFNGPGVTSAASVGVKVQNGAAMVVRDCTIRNFYRGLYGVGCLISRFSNITLNKNYYGMEFIGTLEFKPNDVHFTDMFIYDNIKAVRCVDFQNGAIHFTNCEIEGNNLTGSISDEIKVVEFSTAGKITLSSCHFEDNAGQYNVFYSATPSGHLAVIGCEVIPGDSCGNALYISNAEGAANFSVIESRITNNDTGLGQKQIFVGTGCKGTIIGPFNGNLSGDLSFVTLIRDGKIGIGGVMPDFGGIRSKSPEGIGYDCEGMFRFVDALNNRTGYQTVSTIVLDAAAQYRIVTGHGTCSFTRLAGIGPEPGTDLALSLGSASLRWSQTYTGYLNLASSAVAAAAGTVNLGSTTATTIGAAGGASALPAAPLGYLVAFVGATQVKIPYYTA